ncbi:MAG: hypothetical protein MUC63_09470, partial [Planctomycetes bacterium]|nr:hypothetical protein [Planctomycetota bacterium]
MNRILALAAVLGVCASAGPAPLRAQQPGPASPREAFERAKSAVAAKDWEGLWGLASQESQEDFIAELIKSKKKWRREDPAAKERLTGRTYGELLKMGWSRLFAEFVGAARAKDLSALDPGAWAFAGERIDGERAEVAFQGAGSPRTLR